MYKNYKEKKIMFLLFLVCACTISFVAAMDFGAPQPMELSETSAFQHLMELVGTNNTPQVKEVLDVHTLAWQVVDTNWGRDPLSWAAHHGNVEMAHLLLRNGFDLVANADGHSALHTAAYHKKSAVLRALLTYPYHMPKQELFSAAKQELATCLKKSAEYNPCLEVITRVPDRFIIKHLFDQESVESYVHSLAITHLGRILLFLNTRAQIASITMTPYEAAYDAGDQECIQLLEPTDFEERLCHEVMTNYKKALDDALRAAHNDT